MKTMWMRCVAVTLAASLVAGSVFAQRPQNGRGAGGPPGGAAGLFGVFDSNGDGTLEKNEVPGPVWDRLVAADADKDGAVTLNEVTGLRSGRPGKADQKPAAATGKPTGRPAGPPWAAARIMFQRFDTDRNSELVEDEIPAPAWKYLSRADADEDGSVTQKEVIVFVGTRMFDRFDENKDDSLIAEEVPALMWDRISAADADDDGIVTFEEYLDAILSAPRGGKPAAAPKAR